MEFSRVKTAWGSSFNSRLHIVNRGRSGELTLPDPSSVFLCQKMVSKNGQLFSRLVLEKLSFFKDLRNYGARREAKIFENLGLRYPKKINF